jgi:hypothetical protein
MWTKKQEDLGVYTPAHPVEGRLRELDPCDLFSKRLRPWHTSPEFLCRSNLDYALVGDIGMQAQLCPFGDETILAYYNKLHPSVIARQLSNYKRA